jgi:DNA polymerase III gamma/tau subunit
MLGVVSDADINHLISLIIARDPASITTIQSFLDQGILLDTLLDDLALSASTNPDVTKTILSFVLTVRQTKKYLPTPILACTYALT